MTQEFTSTSVAVLSQTSLPDLAAAAWRAVQAATTVTERKEIGAKLDAIMEYFRRTRASREALNTAAEIHLWNQRYLGEMLRAELDLRGHHGRLNNKNVEANDVFTLAKAGITRDQSSNWQRLADIDEFAFRAAIDDARMAPEPLTAKLLLRMFKAQQTAEENELLKRAGAFVSEGTFETIVIDPPWDMEKIERDVRPNQVGFDYPTMTEAELAAFEPMLTLPAADCHLFCWTTQRFLPASLRLVEAWGFKYVLTMVWHKTGGFQPVGLPQFNCEFVVYARRGAPRFVDTRSFDTCVYWGRREHSRKPDKFYDMIREATAGPRIDIFSREPRDGFDQYGNETGKFGEAA